MRKRIAAVALGAALAVVPVAANAEQQAGSEQAITATLNNESKFGNETKHEPYEERYLRLYDRYADAFGVQAAGRNIVLRGELKNDEVRTPAKSEVTDDADHMEASLDAPGPTEVAPTESAATTIESSGGGYASSSTVQCESGGDYGAVNPAGYYGAYQFDQQTWDAYAPEGYAGTNPAEAPPAVQDAAAANVPYDAWPSC